MNNQIQETVYILPLTFLYNGLVSAPVLNPQYLLLEDTLTAQFGPNGSADVAVGNFNFNIPVGAVVTGIQFTVRARVGSINVPPATLTFNALDDTTGTIIYHPYTAPFDGMSQSLETYTFGSPNYLFGTTWTVDQINNFKLQLLGSDGDIFVDDVQAQVFFYVPGTPTPPTPDSNFCLTCESPIQGVEYFLALDLTSTATKAYVYNFNYADGTPIQISDLGDCGGVIEVVLDEGQVATNGSNFMENAEITNITRLPSGLVELDFGTINNRGLMFRTPYAHDVNLLSPHSVNAKLIISNSAPYENKKLRQCQKGVVFSAPITVEDEGLVAVTAMETLNFIGPNVQAEVDPSDPTKANVTILTGATSQQATIETAIDGTIDAATSLTISQTITDANYLRIWVVTDNQTISSVTFNGVAATLIGAVTNAGANLKVALYGLINPASGTHNIVITMAVSSHITGGGTSFIGVDVANPTDGVSSGAIGSSTAPSDTVTTAIQNTVLMDVVGGVVNTTAFTQGALWTINSQVNASNRPGASSTRKVLVPAAVIDTYTTAPTGAWAILVAGVRGIATPAGGVQTVTGLDTDNTDPANPVIKISTGAGIGGDGTPGNPLTASGTPLSLEVDGTPNTDQTLLNLISGTNITLTDNGSGGVTIDASGGGSGQSLSIAVTQTAHGLSVGDVIKSNGTANEFSKAQADSAVNAEVVGIVTAVASVNAFTYDKDIMGYAGAGIPAGTPGEAIFLDPTTAGAMTVTEPITAGQISKPLGVLLTSGALMNFTADYRGQEQQAIITGGSSLIASGATPVVISGGGTNVSIFSITAPGNALSTGNVFKIKVFFNGLNINAGSTFSLDLKYGGSVVANIGLSTTSVDSVAGGGIAEFAIIAAGATNAQLGVGGLYSVPGGFANNDQARGGGDSNTLAIDSTISQTLDLTCTCSNNVNINGYIIELVS